MNWRVSCEFESREVAEAFFEALADWLTMTVSLPEEERFKTLARWRNAVGQLQGSRHWLYEDASPSLGACP